MKFLNEKSEGIPCSKRMCEFWINNFDKLNCEGFDEDSEDSLVTKCLLYIPDFSEKKTLVTVCYFEDPAAKTHIEFWERCMGKRIVQKTIYKNSCLDFIVKRNDGKEEYIFCVPINLLDLIDVDVLIKKHYKNYEYLKVLIFGCISSRKLEKIQSFMKKKNLF